MSGLINKAKETLSGNHHNTTTSSNSGPHNSNAANKLDPRVDSDRDGRNDPTSHVGGYGNTQGYTSQSSTTAGHGAMGGTGAVGSGLTSSTGHHTSNAGPHSSNLANKLDPRVDSDRDGRNDPTSHVGGVGNTQGYTGHSATTSGHPTAGYGGTTSGHTTAGYGATGNTSSNAGPHSSGIANKLDPRVDSDFDGRNDPASRTGGLGQTQGYTPHSTTTTGHSATGAVGTGTGAGYGTTGHTSSNAGPHSSNIANKLDPRVDSDRDGRNDPTSRTGGLGNTQGYTPHSSTTTGHNATGVHSGGAASLNQPVHNSALLNKLDPRVKDVAAANAAAGNY